MLEEIRSHLAQDDAIVLSIQYFIMGWVLLPSHPAERGDKEPHFSGKFPTISFAASYFH